MIMIKVGACLAANNYNDEDANADDRDDNNDKTDDDNNDNNAMHQDLVATNLAEWQQNQINNVWEKCNKMLWYLRIAHPIYQ